MLPGTRLIPAHVPWHSCVPVHPIAGTCVSHLLPPPHSAGGQPVCPCPAGPRPGPGGAAGGSREPPVRLIMTPLCLQGRESSCAAVQYCRQATGMTNMGGRRYMSRHCLLRQTQVGHSPCNPSNAQYRGPQVLPRTCPSCPWLQLHRPNGPRLCPWPCQQRVPWQ
jgi:hypothetical protein